MSNVWSRMPHWSTLLQRWTGAMERHGVNLAEGLTTVVDVVCDDLSELRTVSGLRHMWIDRGSSLYDRPIPAFHLLSLEMSYALSENEPRPSGSVCRPSTPR